jgi:hypothetical protein
VVIPAEAGIFLFPKEFKIPAFAGMTLLYFSGHSRHVENPFSFQKHGFRSSPE